MLEGRKIIRRCYQAANQSAISQYLLQQAGGSERLLVLWQVLKVAHTHTHTQRSVCQFSLCTLPRPAASWSVLVSTRLSKESSMLWTLRAAGELSSAALSCIPMYKPWPALQLQLDLTRLLSWASHTRDLITLINRTNGRLQKISVFSSTLLA